MILFSIFISIYLLLGVNLAIIIMKELKLIIERYELGWELSDSEEEILDELGQLNKLIRNSELTLYIFITLFWLLFLADWLINRIKDN